MRRIEHLEKIIIGTLLDSNSEHNFFDECRCCITADMFSDIVRSRIYSIVSDMNMKGIPETDPNTIFEHYGEKVLDILPTMLDLVTDYSFIYLKTDYNEKVFRISFVNGVKPHYTDVTFTDYVNQFLKLYENEKGTNPTGAKTAAA